MATFLAASLYAAGLWISQMHLGRYGITGFVFSDSRYFVTGVWFLFSLLPCASFVGLNSSRKGRSLNGA